MSSQLDATRSQIRAESTSWFPDGFDVVMGPDECQYLVPDFFVPALEHTLGGQKKKEGFNIENENGSVGNISYCYSFA